MTAAPRGIIRRMPSEAVLRIPALAFTVAALAPVGSS